MNGSASEMRSQKARLRSEALARRDALGDEARIEASLAISALLDGALHFDPGTIVSGFLPIRSEIDLRPLMARLADRGARLCVPAIVGGELEFRQLLRGGALVPQGFGTLAPDESAAVLDPELMLVPLSAFDKRCHRIGYGRGFYDRAINRLREKGGMPRLVGVAFAAQEVELVPTEDHDVALDMIATEAGLRRPN